MKKEIRLYNLLFPMWMFFIWPSILWLLILPANFVIDSLVLMAGMYYMQLEDKKEIWQKTIRKIWLFGFLSDFIGATLIFLLMMLLDRLGVSYNPILFPGTTLLAIPGVILAGGLIYWLNRRYSFRALQDQLTAQHIHKLCLILAVFTAPYVMMVPLYG